MFCADCVMKTNHFLVPQTTTYKWMFGETTIFYVKIWNHPIETTIYKWLFGVPGSYDALLMIQKSGEQLTSWGIGSWNAIIYQGFFTSKRWVFLAGFLNHQQYFWIFHPSKLWGNRVKPWVFAQRFDLWNVQEIAWNLVPIGRGKYTWNLEPKWAILVV